MTYQIKFGTDGWRGVIAEDYTFDNVRRAAQGFASYLLEKGKAGQMGGGRVTTSDSSRNISPRLWRKCWQAMA